ncbi:MAG: 50S ribosomal protein L11 methyltransferase [Geobacter sp.]|nr:50S ribosomal protein L11 methyltransferase [Geobacter sp.]
MSGRIFQPFHVGGFTIIPEGEPRPTPCGIPLVMGKKGAFGSGEHETTASCLAFLEQLPDLEGAEAFDLGSGTGILAIAAARLGAKRVVALDIEPAAAESCLDNVRLNGVEDRVHAVCGELACVRKGSCDIFLANIYADIHLALADQMVSLTRPGGLLILSGIPLQDKFDIQSCFWRLGCEQTDMDIMEDFATIVMRKQLT